MAQYRSPEALKNKREYDKEYNKKYFKQKTVVFNTQFPDDIALFEWIRTRPEGGNQYIKRLVREDMAKHPETPAEAPAEATAEEVEADV